MSATLTRDEARAAWAASGLTYVVLTKDVVADLRRRIHRELRASGLMNGSMRATRSAKIQRRRDGTVDWVDVRCSAYYFDDRQAVTFESHGFVGFAGWASDENVQPILKAFLAWLADVTINNAAAGRGVAA